MRVVPVLHFSGNFRFHMPEANNDPATVAIPFDASKTKEEVITICGCDPAKYFEFEFFNTTVSQVTYSDGTTAIAGDSILGNEIHLAGFLPDVSPSAICARLFAASMRIGSSVQGNLDLAVQSDLRLSIRPEGFGDESAAAHYESILHVTTLNAPAGSRYHSELGSVNEFEVYIHLNHYTRVNNSTATPDTRLTGDVYGYIRPVSAEPSDSSRVLNRRVVAHPDLSNSPTVESTFLTGMPGPVMRITDIDGFYDIDVDNSILCLRYLDFIPFLDRDYTTPDITRYKVYLQDSAHSSAIDVGEFVGNHEEMLRTGGLHVFRLPPSDNGFAGMRLVVEVIKDGEFVQPLMIETEWDIVMAEGRGRMLPSASTENVSFRVWRNNSPVSGHSIRLRAQAATPPGHNRRSPRVAFFPSATVTTGVDGRAVATIESIDFNNTGGVFDPVTGLSLSSLPWDRYYGNYVFAEIDNPLRRTPAQVEQIEIPVRVLHFIAADSIPETPSFATDISPLFSYYIRYFHWLHVAEIAGVYSQFIDLQDYDSVVDNIGQIILRLQRLDSDVGKMPRSRDFPFGGIDLLEKWRDAGFAP